MTAKADFNAEEWSTIVEAPVLAGMRVVSAGRGGRIRESLAIAKVYAAARQAEGQSDLLDAIVSSPPAVDRQGLQGAGDLAAATGDRLREALRILKEKATVDEESAYKRFVLGVAQAAAEAHKEGGFIGIGGKRISDEERVALDEIEAVLDENVRSCRGGWRSPVSDRRPPRLSRVDLRAVRRVGADPPRLSSSSRFGEIVFEAWITSLHHLLGLQGVADSR